MATPEIDNRAPSWPDVPAVVAPPRRPPWLAIGLGVLAGLALLIFLALIGELGPFLAGSLNVLPFAVLGLLASLGETRGWARWLTYIALVLLLFGILGISAMFVFATAASPALANPQTMSPEALLPALGPTGRYLVVGFGLVVVALLPLIGGVLRAVARVLPLRPESLTNAVGLSTTLGLALLPLTMLLMLGGQPPLLTIVAQAPAETMVASRPIDLVYGLIWLLPASLVLVGWPVRRDLRSSIARLGLVVPTWRQVAMAVGLAAVMVVAIQFVIGPAIEWLVRLIGWPVTDTRAFEQLMTGLITPIGAVVIGVTAGLGEEVAVRGVLQPRVGIVLANLAFTAAHAYQYGFDALGTVFVVGLALGLLRARTNTTTSAIAHGSYNFILVMLSIIQGGGG